MQEYNSLTFSQNQQVFCCWSKRMRTLLLSRYSRPQRSRSFWSAPRIATSGQGWHRKSAISRHSEHAQSQVWQSHSKPECRWTWSEVAILGADQKERGLWERICLDNNRVRMRLDQQQNVCWLWLNFRELYSWSFANLYVQQETEGAHYLIDFAIRPTSISLTK